MNIKKYLIIIFIYFYSFFVFSDTGSFVSGKNGLVIPLKNNQITMSDEKIIIDVYNIGNEYYKIKYDCEFTLENDSNLNQSLLIGFPIKYSYLIDSMGLNIYYKIKTVYSFSVKINNNPVDYQIFLQGLNPELDQIPQYDEVYGFNVDFKKKEKKIIHLSYIVIEHIGKIGDIKINYILKSALTWDKPITKGKIIINFNFFINTTRYNLEKKIFGLDKIPLEYEINESENLTSIIFDINNLKPSFDINIHCLFNHYDSFILMKQYYYNKKIEKIGNIHKKINDINDLDEFYILLLFLNRNYNNLTEELKSKLINIIDKYLNNKLQSEDSNIFELCTILYNMINDEENKYYNNEEIINKLNISIEKKFNIIAKEYTDRTILINKLFKNKTFDRSYLIAAVNLESIIEINEKNSLIYYIKKPLIEDNKLIEESKNILKELYFSLINKIKNNNLSITDELDLLKYLDQSHFPIFDKNNYSNYVCLIQDLLIKYLIEYNKNNDSYMAQKLEALANFINGAFSPIWGETNDPHIIMPGILNNYYLMKNIYFTLGNYYFSTNIDKAINYYNLALNNYNYSKAKNSKYFLYESGIEYKGTDFALIYYIFYNLCCAYIKKDNINTAFDYLKKAIDEGYPNKDWLLKDPDIKILREKYNEKFNKIVKKTPYEIY